MRRLVAIAALVALGAAFVVPAFAQQPVIPQWVRNNVRVTIQEAANALPVQEQFPAQTFQVFVPGWMNSQFTARLAGGLPPAPSVLQDSTDARDVRGCNGLALGLFPTFDDSVSAVTLAFQFRWHYSSAVDSQSTFVEMATRTVPPRTDPTTPVSVAGVLAAATNTNLHTANAAASLGLFSPVPLGAFVVGPGISPGTIVTARGTSDSTITIFPGCAQGVNGTVQFFPQNPVTSAAIRDSLGSLSFIPATSNGLSRYSIGAAAVANVDSLATPDEQVVVLTNISGVSRGRLIRIRVPEGPSLNSAGPFLSVHVRYLNGYNASGVAWGNGTSGFEPFMRLRMDLIGWR